MSVEAVKDKVWKKCGTSVNSVRLELYDDCKNKLFDLSDESRPLGFYSPLDGFRIHIIDLDPSSVTSGGWLEDTSLVEKYSISEDEYNKRSGTFRKFKEQMANPSAFRNKISISYFIYTYICESFQERCQITTWKTSAQISRVKGTRYFQCPPLCGAMVRPDKVKVGDYPERDPFEEDEI
ncbi:hypothetical protein PVK06_012586 [Gossypium arboreum]|uniref:Ubiquitin-like domain-containing protein n=1 Tax=Gossypium arboreum TaxID=29729 RepID=A0ABR0QBT3_GOSAR|nr:hypothetical protein PVK06_012586 [Gossypium arboreum]